MIYQLNLLLKIMTRVSVAADKESCFYLSSSEGSFFKDSTNTHTHTNAHKHAAKQLFFRYAALLDGILNSAHLYKLYLSLLQIGVCSHRNYKWKYHYLPDSF